MNSLLDFRSINERLENKADKTLASLSANGLMSKEDKVKLDGLELTTKRVSIADSTNKFKAINVEEVRLENKTSILELQTELGTNKTTLQNNINVISEVL